MLPIVFRCRLDNADEEVAELIAYLRKHPEKAETYNWKKLDSYRWLALLCKRPKYARYCDWSKIDGDDWAVLLCAKPQFAKHCDWSKLKGDDWAQLLARYPEYAEHCDWGKLGGREWEMLLNHQPQFAVHCDWSKLDDNQKQRLFKNRPELKDLCDKRRKRTKMTSDSHIYCSQKTWLEGAAVEQFNRVLGFEGILKGAGFPDLHPGRGVPVGAAFLSKGVIYPALIGNDIGCGMTLFDTGIPARKLKTDKLLRKLGDAPEDIIRQLSLECLPEMDGEVEDGLGMLGTLGHGNHFAEILELEGLLDADVCKELPVTKDNALLLIHSGSRAYGEALWRAFAAKHGDEGVSATSEDGMAYLERHAQLIRWASFNRRLVAKAFSKLLSCDLTEILDSTHNSIAPVGEGQYIHRKGASAVEPGRPVVVAGSRGTFSYLVKPVGDLESHLFSLAHGAGRKWNRQSTAVRVREKHSDMQSLLRTKLGTKVVCPNKELLYEEAPEAYKNIEDTIDDLRSFGLATPIAQLKPIVNIKP